MQIAPVKGSTDPSLSTADADETYPPGRFFSRRRPSSGGLPRLIGLVCIEACGAGGPGWGSKACCGAATMEPGYATRWGDCCSFGLPDGETSCGWRCCLWLTDWSADGKQSVFNWGERGRGAHCPCGELGSLLGEARWGPAGGDKVLTGGVGRPVWLEFTAGMMFLGIKGGGSGGTGTGWCSLCGSSTLVTWFIRIGDV